MKKFMYLAPLIGLLATSCVTDKPDVIADDAGQLHYTTPYQDDTRGQNVFPATWNVKGKKLFVFDPNADAWAAYDAQGNRVMTGSASGGRDKCPDSDQSCRTVVGTFAVFNKKGADCKSNEYPLARDGHVAGGAKMPYCMHFHDGYAIHAAYEVPKYNTSHGCIRVLPGAAKWLNENFIDVGTTVLVLPYA
ncbi:L,D-transpeptidase [Legionella longbeachae]|uniref:Enhanced entry protein EnhA n=1 Tax=Legionella longbeachae serogroup 1 (strain NSW150) TaxID=661367 RepID=D3HSD8_LEGLN|nr:L,D-transpeptidase [Legionella longbeachae]VEE02320.1 enhanced entry protein EnhA [Legionella oakridgensis]HBD7398188.1 L,D-transpeptidase [Legionella pneumophila]ARB91392.1 L,D-transpeptidase [Legionella longbeachae]ARM32181.1 L,D-transpeptidase [Legionella longbeachae]EEZ95038.1 enhanced entry protein EnhA [Legionella longbeachae D-4968]